MEIWKYENMEIFYRMLGDGTTNLTNNAFALLTLYSLDSYNSWLSKNVLQLNNG